MKLPRILPPVLVASSLSLIALSLVYADGTPEDSVGPGIGFLQEGAGSRGSGTLLFHADGTYENGYAWRYGGVVPPDYGAFAERFASEAEVTAAVFDFTQTGTANTTMDVFVWDQGDGEPGAVLCALIDVDPGEIAFWPSISRHTVELADCETGADWWVGYWGNWPGSVGWFIAADLDGPGGGSPFTHVAPGIGYPTGWNDVSIIWGPTQALGIGAIVNVAAPPTLLQEMIDAADAGEIVLVPPGTYRGIGNKRLDFHGKDIILQAEAGPNATIIDCEGDGRAFFFHSGESTDAVVEGFTIRNGRVAGGQGGAVLVNSGASATIRGCVIESSLATNGGAVAVVDGGIEMYGTQLDGNEAMADGGASTFAENAVVLLQNVVQHGAVEGAVWADQSQVTVTGGQIRGSSSSLVGAAVRATQGAEVEIDFAVLSGNLAAEGGALAVDETSSATITRSTLTSNRAQGDGGAIWAGGGVAINRTIVWSNCAAGSGDQILAGASSTVEVQCGAVDPLGVSGSVTWLGEQVTADPMLCDPADCQTAPTSIGNLHLAEGSPGLPLHSPCGMLLGPLWIRCPVPVIPTGACCLSSSECFLTVDTLCGPYGGFYAGDGSTCEPEICEPASVDGGVSVPSVVWIQLAGENPSQGDVRFVVETAESGEMQATVYDASGRFVDRVFEGSVGAGFHELTWTGRSSDGNGASNGVYYLRARVNGESVSVPVVIAR